MRIVIDNVHEMDKFLNIIKKSPCEGFFYFIILLKSFISVAPSVLKSNTLEFSFKLI